MRSYIILVGLFLFFSSIVDAKPIDESQANQVARNFFASLGINNAHVELSFAPLMTGDEEQALFYLYNNPTGNAFVIISGNDITWPILGYSRNGLYKSNDPIPNFRKWLDGYKLEMSHIMKHELSLKGLDSNKQMWQKLMYEEDLKLNAKMAVSPLLTTRWDQAPYYNDLCPGGSVTGCVATAMAQVMKYWNYPPRGTGFHSYNENNYGTISANFGSTNYDWSRMPNSLNSSNNAVATLMYHCGVSVEMDYSPNVSGAFVISDRSPITHCSEYAFKNYFGYAQTLRGVERARYNTSSWINLIRTELDNQRPVEYAGFGSGGGHAFVCDGYDDNGFFHFNWGWGGAYDGNFVLDALNPSGVGTGGGTGGYNTGQQAVIGVEPAHREDNGGGGGSEDPTQIRLALYEGMRISNNPVGFGQSFNITANFANVGDIDFSGSISVAAFDQEGRFVDFIEVINNAQLQSGYAYNNAIVFSTDGLLSLLPGRYQLASIFMPEGSDWTIVENYQSNVNYMELSVTYSSEIELNKNIEIDVGTEFAQGSTIRVNLNVLNQGNSTFIGDYSVDLYDLDGNFIEEIAVLNEGGGLPSGFTYNSPYLSFQSGAIQAEPGTYLMALSHRVQGGNWTLSGSSNFQNPIYVNVTDAGVSKDRYENNDTEATAFNIVASFNNDFYTFQTQDANSHHGADYDFFEMNLSQGYDYEIETRVHDSYNSGDGATYTNDVLWSYKIANGAWSDAIDDIIDNDIRIENGGRLRLHVAPYFQGEVGTYRLEVKVRRFRRTNISEPSWANVSLFPNPVKDQLHISTGVSKVDLEIISTDGKWIEKHPNVSGDYMINVEFLTPGIYYMKVDDQFGNSKNLKFIKVQP